MKKIVLPLTVCLMLTSCGNNYIEDVSYQEIESKISRNETFTYFIGQKGCHGCAYFRNALKQAHNKFNFESNLYYCDASNIEYDYLISTIKNEFVSRIPDFYYSDHPIYSKEGFYTPSIFRYYQGVLVYSKIESPEYSEIPYLFDNVNIDIGYYQNIEYIKEFNNFDVYIYLNRPLLNEGDQSFYVMQSNLSLDEKIDIVELYNNYNDTTLEDIPDTVKITFVDAEINNVE